jgi:hypothetical protein
MSGEHSEIDQLRDCLNDCVALLLGHVSGSAQRDGIIRESIAALGSRYSGPANDAAGPRDAYPRVR